jgi:hypothetical protein
MIYDGGFWNGRALLGQRLERCLAQHDPRLALVLGADAHALLIAIWRELREGRSDWRLVGSRTLPAWAALSDGPPRGFLHLRLERERRTSLLVTCVPGAPPEMLAPWWPRFHVVLATQEVELASSPRQQVARFLPGLPIGRALDALLAPRPVVRAVEREAPRDPGQRPIAWVRP